MLRFYKEFMENCLLALLYVERSVGIEMDDITQWAVKRTWHQEMKSIIKSRAYSRSDMNLKTMIATLTEKLGKLKEERETGQDGNLINAIVRTLQLPFPRNVMTGDTLKALRTALLLPEEIGGLIQRLEARELRCGGCSRKLKSEEMVTIAEDRQGVILMCHACMRPSNIACDHAECQEHVLMDKKYRALHKKNVVCVTHKEMKEMKEGEETGLVETLPIPYRPPPPIMYDLQTPDVNMPIPPRAYTNYTYTYDERNGVTRGITGPPRPPFYDTATIRERLRQADMAGVPAPPQTLPDTLETGRIFWTGLDRVNETLNRTPVVKLGGENETERTED